MERRTGRPAIRSLPIDTNRRNDRVDACGGLTASGRALFGARLLEHAAQPTTTRQRANAGFGPRFGATTSFVLLP